jgi:hypothetical protein
MAEFGVCSLHPLDTIASRADFIALKAENAPQRSENYGIGAHRIAENAQALAEM